MSIYHEFKPTYLYIKQHTLTGKLYFGKTVGNPEKYLGSGKLWQHHIKKHGKEHIVTLWYELFPNKDEIQEFALSFSKEMNIVESEQWLNLKLENGLDGGFDKHSIESIEKNRIAHLGKTHTVKTNWINCQIITRVRWANSYIKKRAISLRDNPLTYS